MPLKISVSNLPKHKKKPIRSYVKRSGRLTASQKKAIQTLWSKYVIETNECGVIGYEGHFNSPQKELVVEIGFGNGMTLVSEALDNPEKNFIGIEVYKSGFGHCLNRIEKEKIKNIKLIYKDAVEVLKHNIQEKSLSQVNIFFPDPWPKKRHHKRRLINKDFLAVLDKSIKDQGIINISTDWKDYADQIETVFTKNKHFHLIDRDSRNQKTKFEVRGLDLGHDIFNYSYQLISQRT